jgi:hypothetical protein
VTPERIDELKEMAEVALSGPWLQGMRDDVFIGSARTAIPELIAEIERLRANTPRFSDEVYESARAAIDRSSGSLGGRDEFCVDKAMYVCRMVLLRDTPDEYEAARLRERNAP